MKTHAGLVLHAAMLAATVAYAKPARPTVPTKSPVHAAPRVAATRPTVLAFSLGDRHAAQSLSEHARNLDILSPAVFSAHADGRLTGHISPELASARGRVQMMPSVVNADFSVEGLSALLNSKSARSRLAQNLVTTAKKLHLRGFVIDFEGLSRSERQRYPAWLSDVHARFRAAGLRLGVAVPAPVGTFREAFDNRAIGRATDLVILMAYDQHSRGSAPGPIAGYNWVERVLADTVEAIPPSKLLLGLPMYHRSWTKSSGSRDSTAGSHRQALSLLNELGAELQWDPLSRSPWFRIESLGTESDDALSGAKATNTVWLEDSRSVSEKIELARRFKLAGVAAWRLGQEDPDIWGVFESYRGVTIASAKSAPPRRHRRAPKLAQR